MSLLVTTVLGQVVKVVTTHDDGAVHLGGFNHSLQDTATDGHVASERAFLIDELSVDRLLRGLDAQTNFADEALISCCELLAQNALAPQEDRAKFSFYSLISKNIYMLGTCGIKKGLLNGLLGELESRNLQMDEKITAFQLDCLVK